MSAVVEVAFGCAPGAVPADEDWVDVSADIDARGDEVAVTARAGRDVGSLDDITPGSLSTALVSAAGKYNRRNSASSYAGQLRRGVPIRVRAAGSFPSLYGLARFGVSRFGVTEGDGGDPRWTGLVSSQWDLDLLVADPVVPVSAHDVLGELATASMPVSAFDADCSELAPDRWWRPSADGWIDQVTGERARHSGALVSTDPLVDGGDDSWWSPRGGEGTLRTGFIDPTVPVVWSAWVRLDSNPVLGQRVVLFTQNTELGSGATPTFEVAYMAMPTTPTTVGWRLEVWVGGQPEGMLRAESSRLNLADGRTHQITVSATVVPPIPGGSGTSLRIWVDGELVATGGYSLWPGLDSPTDPAVTATIGAQGSPYPDSFYSGTIAVGRWVGVIDHVAWWVDTAHDPATIAATLFEAGRFAWAGDRLDQRVARIVAAAGWGDWLGDLDVSGIVTHQGYRRGQALDLLRTIERTEHGRIWCDRDGKVRFTARSWPHTAAVSATTQLVVSDDPDVLDDPDSDAVEPMVGSSIQAGPLGVVTTARVTSANGRQQTATNPTVAALFGAGEPVELSGLLHATDRRSLALAERIVFERSRDVPAVTAVVDTGTLPTGVADSIGEGWAVQVVKAADVDCAGDPVGDPLDVIAHVIAMAWAWSTQRELLTITTDPSRAGLSPFRWGVSVWDGDDTWT